MSPARSSHDAGRRDLTMFESATALYMQPLPDEMIREIAAYWPTRSIGLTCRRFVHLLDPMRYVIKSVHHQAPIVTLHRLPDGMLHGPGEIVDGMNTTTLSCVHGFIVSTTRAQHNLGVVDRAVLKRGVEFRWYFGRMFTRYDLSRSLVCHGRCSLDEYDDFIASYNGPPGIITSLRMRPRYSKLMCLFCPRAYKKGAADTYTVCGSSPLQSPLSLC